MIEEDMKKRYLYLMFCIFCCLSSTAQSNWYPQHYETTPIDYDFEQDGIYYKFAPAPDGSFIDTSYRDADDNLVKDGVYTGMEKEDGNILWVTGKEYIIEIGYVYGGQLPSESVRVYNDTYSGDVYIPDYVTYEGKEYPVKGLCRDAFRSSNYRFGNANGVRESIITSIRLPNTLVYIDDIAFASEYRLPIKEIPKSVRYMGSYTYRHDIVLHDNILTLKSQELTSAGKFYYPSNAVYAGQVFSYKPNVEMVYPKKMRHLICGDKRKMNISDKTVIPDNGDFFVHQYAVPSNVSTIFSYAPIMKNSRPGYGFRTLIDAWKDTSCQYEKTLYVLSGLKEAYAKEWPELLAGAPYTKDDETLYFTEDHIIEISREEMDAMVEAAGLTVPTSVSEVEVSPSKKVKETIYTPDGRRWQALQKGVNIVRQSDGTTRKVYVK